MHERLQSLLSTLTIAPSLVHIQEDGIWLHFHNSKEEILEIVIPDLTSYRALARLEAFRGNSWHREEDWINLLDLNEKLVEFMEVE